MPRDASGNYTLPAGNPVISGTTITATWANDTMSDLGNEITNSLDRSGRGGLLAPLRLDDGTTASPALSFTNETGLGLYRQAAGNLGVAAGGSDLVRFNATNQLQVWRDTGWHTVPDVDGKVTFQLLELESAGPFVYWNETDVTANNGYWRLGASDELFVLQGLTDAGGGGGDLVQFTRSNQAITAMELTTGGNPRLRLRNTGGANFIEDVKIGGAVDDTPAVRLHVSDTGSGNVAVIESTAVQSGGYGPTIELHRNSTGSLASHGQGVVKFAVDNSSDAKVTMGQLYLTTSDMTAASETGYMTLSATASGSEVSVFRAYGNRFNVGLNTYIGDLGATPAARLHVSDTVTGDVALLESTAASSTTGHYLTIYRDGGAASASHAVGGIDFTGRDALDNIQDYARILTLVQNPANGSEAGYLYNYVAVSGTLTAKTRIGPTDIHLGDDVYIGDVSTAPSARLHVADTADTVAILESDAAGENVGPALTFVKDTTDTPAIGDIAGVITFNADDSGGTASTYVQLRAHVLSPTAGSEEGELRILTANAAGATPIAAQIGATGNQFIADTKIGGTAGDTPSARLHVADTAAVVTHFDSSNAGNASTVGTEVRMYNTATPTVDATIGARFGFWLDSDTGANQNMANIDVIQDDISNGTEDNSFRFDLRAGGSRAYRVAFYSDKNNFIDDTKIGGAIGDTPSARLHVADSTSATIVRADFVESGGTGGPDVILHRESASPAGGDSIGRILWNAKNSAAAEFNYGMLRGNLNNPAAGAETFYFDFLCANATGLSVPVATVGWDFSNFLHDVGVGLPSGRTVPSAPLHVRNTSAGTTLLVETTDSGTTGAHLDIYANSSSPLAGDIVGRVRYIGRDSAANSTVYGDIITSISDPTAGSEDGLVVINTVLNGTEANRLYVSGGLWMFGATGSDTGPGTINATQFYRNGTPLAVLTAGNIVLHQGPLPSGFAEADGTGGTPNLTAASPAPGVRYIIKT